MTDFWIGFGLTLAGIVLYILAFGANNISSMLARILYAGLMLAIGVAFYVASFFKWIFN